MNIAVIPARGGSKRIPRKNVREFAGKPMIAHSIACALSSGLFDKVIVSTDDEEIAKIARAHGAEVPFLRPKELAQDRSGLHEVIIHAIMWLQSMNISPSAVCCIFATAPFINPEDLKKGLAVLETGQWQYVFSATTYGYPLFRGFCSNENGGLEMIFPEYYDTRSQDLPEAMHDAGQFYWARAQTWMDKIKIFDTNSTIVFIPRCRVQDIDTEEDWKRAQIAWQVLQMEEQKG